MAEKRLKLSQVYGELVSKNGAVVLISEDGEFFPTPSRKDVEPSIDKALSPAANAYRHFIGSEITMEGYLVDNIMYEAKRIRTYEYRGPATKYSEQYWVDRHPKADVLFCGRRLPRSKQSFNADIRQMVTVTDSVIEKDIRDNGLLVDTPDKCNEKIFEIYKHSRKKKINPFSYILDIKAFGCDYFMYPYELREMGKGDCDDWAIELASYLITAGVPEWRVRCVLGLTYSGEGHLTVYVLSDDLVDWHHLNSTTHWSEVPKNYKSLTDFPKTNDPKDRLGIEEILFSFNNRYAWHAFEAHLSDRMIKKIPGGRKFTITPRPN